MKKIAMEKGNWLVLAIAGLFTIFLIMQGCSKEIAAYPDSTQEQQSCMQKCIQAGKIPPECAKECDLPPLPQEQQSCMQQCIQTGKIPPECAKECNFPPLPQRENLKQGNQKCSDGVRGLSNSSNKESPFGLSEVKFFRSEDVEAVKDLGVTNTRNAPQRSLIWPEIGKEKGKYDWGYADDTITTAYNLGVKTFIIVGTERKPGPAKFPDDLDWFLEYLRKAVERYDGDGIDDAPCSPKIDVIQIGNEVDGVWNDTPANYALLLKKSYQTIKKAAPNMKVAIAGVATPEGFYKFYKPILEELIRIKDKPNDQYFDVFDIHWSGQFEGKYSEIVLPDADNKGKTVLHEMRRFVADVKSELAKIGYKNVRIYITEMSDYSGTPVTNPKAPVNYKIHSEKHHASSVIKRFIYALASGVHKIFWVQIVDEHNYDGAKNGYFENVALINNPENHGQSHKKLAYYTYKKMVEILDGSDWDNIQIIRESDGIYIYKFTKNGKPVWVAWNDNPQEKQITISGITSNSVTIIEAVPKYESGKEVTDYSTAFNTQTNKANGGKITFTLKDKPVFAKQ